MNTGITSLLWATGVALVSLLGACSAPQSDTLRFSPIEARNAYAAALQTLKRDPAMATAVFDTDALTTRVRAKRSGADISTEIVAAELAEVFVSAAAELPRILPPDIIRVDRYRAYSNDCYDMELSIPLHAQKTGLFGASFCVTGGTVRFSDMQLDGYSVSSLVSGRIGESTDDIEDLLSDLYD